MPQYDLLATSEQLVTAIKLLAEEKGLPEGEMLAIASMALIDILLIKHSPIQSVERLRDLADMVERRIMLH